MVSVRFTLVSPGFAEGKPMPSKYAHKGVTGGQNISVPLRWENPPAEAKSLALACIDLHPIANKWVHWLVINISKGAGEITEGASLTSKMPPGSVELANTYGEKGYGGPHPPKGSGLHRYEFNLYALDVEKLEFDFNTSLSAFEGAIDGRVVGVARLVGLYER